MLKRTDYSKPDNYAPTFNILTATIGESSKYNPSFNIQGSIIRTTLLDNIETEEDLNQIAIRFANSFAPVWTMYNKNSKYFPVIFYKIPGTSYTFNVSPTVSNINTGFLEEYIHTITTNENINLIKGYKPSNKSMNILFNGNCQLSTILKINYTCSLGGMCHSSQILKRNNLKLCSYPFDWIFSNCNNIIHCIEDNFNIFLDKSYYTNISQSQCGHLKYNNLMFNHHNPLINIDHYNYYVRCVDRFKNLLQKKEHKLFFMIFINNNIIKNNIINYIIDFNNKFSKYTSNYTLLVIFHIPNKQQNHHIFTYNNNIHFLELHTLSSSGGVEFDNNNDNIYLDNIIKSKYNFNIKN